MYDIFIVKEIFKPKGDIVMDMIFAGALLLIVAISVLWSVFIRKLAKTRIKSICVIASVIIYKPLIKRTIEKSERLSAH